MLTSRELCITGTYNFELASGSAFVLPFSFYQVKKYLKVGAVDMLSRLAVLSCYSAHICVKVTSTEDD